MVVNKWTEKIEEQVNQIQDSIDSKPSHNEVTNIVIETSKPHTIQLEKFMKIAENTEKLSQRLAEDVFESVDLNSKKLDDFEDRLNHLREWVEDFSKVSTSKINIDTSGRSTPGLVTKSELMDFEKKLNHKILESLDETNSIMKKIKSQYRDLAKKVDKLSQDKPKAKKSSSRKRLNDTHSQEKEIAKRADSTSQSIVMQNINTNSRRQYNSSDRAITDLSQHSSTKIRNDKSLSKVSIDSENPKFGSKNLENSIQSTLDPHKHTVDVVRTVAIPKTTESANERAYMNMSKETRDEIDHAKTLKRSDRPENSKEFTDFMTFEENNSSELFELSENEASMIDKPRSKNRKHKRSSSRSSKNRNASKTENIHPNLTMQKRSRVEEFESLKKKGRERVPRNLKSRSRSRSTKGSRQGSRQGSKRKSAKKSSRAAKASSIKANLSNKLKDTRIKKVESKKKTLVKDSRLKQKPKNKDSNIKLAKLEKMYQELSELESKC